ncbi:MULTISPECIES: hypothetical protein [Bacillus]|uniref:hypothetical protein n=1 Tax=Bacillus TaxID=1386 RepID=UPI0011559254|nr:MULTISPECIES: hypothetical protein [Bacillus]
MNHLVLNAFIDKETKVGYSQGDMYESTDSERIAFLNKEGYISESTPSDEVSLTNLKIKAKTLKVKGYTKMEKDELIQAIEAIEKAGD